MRNDKIAVVKVVFNNMPDYIFSSQQWKDVGGYKGFIKTGSYSIRDITGIEYTTMSEYEFEALPAWEG